MDAIDSHVHIWTDDFASYPQDPHFAREDFVIPRFTPEDILSLAQANGVSRVVLVQMSYYGFDNRLMLDAIRNYPGRFAGVAVIDEDDSELALTMQRLRQSGVRGFRVFAIDEGAKLADRAGLENMLLHAEREQMVIDFLAAPQLLAQLDLICSRFPETSIVIDHMARIGMNGSVSNAEVDSLCRLARHSRTAVKISAFYALGRKKAPYDDLSPVVRRLYDAFGPSRLMWGSDMPLQAMNGTYKESIDFVRSLEFLTSDDKNRILRDAAQSVFFG